MNFVGSARRKASTTNGIVGFEQGSIVGPLLSYGPDLSMPFQRSASLVDQILKGAKPGDLPIGKPSFELAANLQTAKALKVTIPASILTLPTFANRGFRRGSPSATSRNVQRCPECRPSTSSQPQPPAIRARCAAVGGLRRLDCPY